MDGGTFHIVLRKGVDAAGRTAVLVTRNGYRTRADAEAACALIEVELAASHYNYDAYDAVTCIIDWS